MKQIDERIKAVIYTGKMQSLEARLNDKADHLNLDSVFYLWQAADDRIVIVEDSKADFTFDFLAIIKPEALPIAEKYLMRKLEYEAYKDDLSKLICVPLPGDVVKLEGNVCGEEIGRKAVLDGSVNVFKPGGYMAVFGASAYRSEKYVDSSGGTCPHIFPYELEYLSTTMQWFWRWKDGISGADRGEDYQLSVNLWSWLGRDVQDFAADHPGKVIQDGKKFYYAEDYEFSSYKRVDCLTWQDALTDYLRWVTR